MSTSPKYRTIGTVLIVLIPLLLFCGLCLLMGQRSYWVGNKDLEITFFVEDADTRQPMQAAKIEVLQEDGNWCSDRGQVPLSMVTDANGIAKHLSKNCMCYGVHGWSWSGRLNTFAIHIPGWIIRIVAPGYEPCEFLDLRAPEYHRLVERGKEIATLRVETKLRKVRADKEPKADVKW
jgi:hypothetical protein